MTHHVSLHLRHEVHSYYYDNEERCAAEVKGHIESQDHKLGQKTDGGNVHGAPEREAGQYFVDVLSRLLSWANSGNECPGALQIIRRFLRIEYQCGIEKAEKDYQRCVHQDINRLARRETGCNPL